MRHGAATIALLVACTAPMPTPSSVMAAVNDRGRRNRSEPYLIGVRGENAPLDQIVKLSRKNARRKRRR